MKQFSDFKMIKLGNSGHLNLIAFAINKYKEITNSLVKRYFSVIWILKNILRHLLTSDTLDDVEKAQSD